MNGSHESFKLLVGDVIVFYVSLWLTLFLRTFDIPLAAEWYTHLTPFTIIFGVWILVYFIAGLYERHTSLFRARLPSLIIRTQLINVVIAGLFFFLVPYFGIAPKTNLFIYLGVSSVLVLLWRVYLSRAFGLRRKENTLVIGDGDETDELVEELRKNPVYGMRIHHYIAPSEIEVSPQLQEQILEFIDEQEITTVIADTRSTHLQNVLPVLFNVLFLHPAITFLDTARLYEQIFRRIPVSLLNQRWFLDHITRDRRVFYDLFHRVYDLFVGVLVAGVTLVALPFVWLAIYLDDHGSLFVVQERVGQHNRRIRILKFRSMTGSDSGAGFLESTLRVTTVGAVLRATRLDEFPQALALLRGELSFIGPRPELPELVSKYAEAVPYYNTRHLIKPGLTGWAQINHHAHPHHGIDVHETRNKLSYDLYYLKNRSLTLDIEIALKTLKTLVTAAGK